VDQEIAAAVDRAAGDAPLPPLLPDVEDPDAIAVKFTDRDGVLPCVFCGENVDVGGFEFVRKRDLGAVCNDCLKERMAFLTGLPENPE
jgi:hypothetical protein